MGRRLHPWPLRIMHWVNAVVMLIMITSGWGIYDDDVIIRGFHFSSFWRLGDWAAWSLNWHFAGMWFLVINGLIYLAYGFASGRFREKLLPIRPTEVMQTVIDTLHFRIAHEDITVYNAVQKLLYIIVILAGIDGAMLAPIRSSKPGGTAPRCLYSTGAIGWLLSVRRPSGRHNKPALAAAARRSAALVPQGSQQQHDYSILKSCRKTSRRMSSPSRGASPFDVGNQK